MTWPGTVLSLLNAPEEGRARWAARALGARHLVQARLQWRGPQRLPWSALPDGIHALSAGALAAHDRRWRRPASIDAVVAAMFGLTTLAAADDERGRTR